MEPLTVHLNTRTGERTVSDQCGMNGEDPEAEVAASHPAAMDSSTANDDGENVGSNVDSVDNDPVSEGSNPPTVSRGPIVLRRGGGRPTNLANRRGIVRPNPEHLPSVPSLTSPSRPDDLRNELSRSRGNGVDQVAPESIEPDSIKIVTSIENSATGEVSRKIEYSAGSEVNMEDENGIDVEFPELTGDDVDAPIDGDLRGQLSKRSPVKQVNSAPPFLSSNKADSVDFDFAEHHGHEIEEDRLSLTADDDIELVPPPQASKSLDKTQSQKPSATPSKAPSKSQSSSTVQSSQASSKNSAQSKQVPPEKNSMSSVKAPPSKPIPTTSSSKLNEKGPLKQPPLKPETRTPARVTEVKSSTPSNGAFRTPPPKEMSIDKSADKKSPVAASGKSDAAPAKPVIVPENRDSKTSVPGKVSPSPSATSTKGSCQSCSAIQSIESRLTTLLKQNFVRPRAKDNSEVMTQREYQDFSSSAVEMAKRCRDCKLPTLSPLVASFVLANGRIDDTMLTDLLPRIIVAGGTTLKDFQLHIKPIVEQYSRWTSDSNVLLQLLGLYWYFGDWFGLWENILQLCYSQQSRCTSMVPLKNLPITLLRNLARLVITVSSDRAGIVASLITNLSKREISSNFKPQVLAKLVPLLEKRSLYKLRVKLEDALGSQPKSEDLKPKAVNDRMNSLGRRLQNNVSKKQSIGLPDELPFLNPGPDDIVYELSFILRHLPDDLMVESFGTFLSFFNPRTTSDHPDLKRLFSGVVFYLTRYSKSKSTITRLASKLEKVGVEFTSNLSEEVVANLPGDLKFVEVSLKMAEQLSDSSAQLPDVKSKLFLWVVGPSFIPISKISAQDEVSGIIHQKASFFNSLLGKIADTSVNAQMVDYFSALVKGYMNDVSSSNFKDEYKSLFDFEKFFNRMAVNCVRTQRTALLTELFEHATCSAIFPKSGHPSELIFRLFIAAFALRDDKGRSISAYRLGCTSSVFPVQPESTSEGCVVIKVQSYFTEPELITLLVSTFDCAWKLYQDGSFSPTTLPQFGIKIEAPRSDVSNENISILTCSQSDDQVLQRIRSAANHLGLHFQKLNSGIIKLDAKDIVAMFGKWKSSSKPPSYPKFEPSAEKLMQLARDAGAFKPAVVSSSASLERSSSSAAPSGSKRPAPPATEKSSTAPSARSSVTNQGSSGHVTDANGFKIPKRSHSEDVEGASPVKSARPALPQTGSARRPPERKNDARENNYPPPPPLISRDQDRRSSQNLPSLMSHGNPEDPMRTTERMLRRVGQYLQVKELEQSQSVGNSRRSPMVTYPTVHIDSMQSNQRGSMPMSGPAHPKLIEAATSAVFAAVRDTTGSSQGPFDREPTITKAWEEFEERRSANTRSGAVNPYGGGMASGGAVLHDTNPYGKGVSSAPYGSDAYESQRYPPPPVNAGYRDSQPYHQQRPNDPYGQHYPQDAISSQQAQQQQPQQGYPRNGQYPPPPSSQSSQHHQQTEYGGYRNPYDQSAPPSSTPRGYFAEGSSGGYNVPPYGNSQQSASNSGMYPPPPPPPQQQSWNMGAMPSGDKYGGSWR